MTACIHPAGPVIDMRLGQMQGQPVTVAFNKLGYPTGESQVAGQYFYYWSNTGTVLVPTTVTTSGVAFVGKKTVSYDQTTTGPDQVVPVACSIRVFVDQRNIITAHDYTGNQEACAAYAQKLDATYKPGPF